MVTMIPTAATARSKSIAGYFRVGFGASLGAGLCWDKVRAVFKTCLRKAISSANSFRSISSSFFRGSTEECFEKRYFSRS